MMEIYFRENEKAMIVEICGEIDHHCADEAREKIDKEFERSRCKYIIFDFGKVDFMDSSGIGMIIGRYKIAERRGGKVIACNIQSEVKKIFKISGLFRIIECCSDMDEAIGMLRTGRPENVI
ncbi:MAG: anti-sigma F factor antagonist [Firmicutes bacterium]|nr:anti-sigma F factor antagonist [Bacillota bacterium]